MYRDTASRRLDEMETRHDFEQKYGREMTPEERTLFSLSGVFLSAPDDVARSISQTGSTSSLLNFMPRINEIPRGKKAA